MTMSKHNYHWVMFSFSFTIAFLLHLLLFATARWEMRIHSSSHITLQDTKNILHDHEDEPLSFIFTDTVGDKSL
jgi:hypothetical protein